MGNSPQGGEEMERERTILAINSGRMKNGSLVFIEVRDSSGKKVKPKSIQQNKQNCSSENYELEVGRTYQIRIIQREKKYFGKECQMTIFIDSKSNFSVIEWKGDDLRTIIQKGEKK